MKELLLAFSFVLLSFNIASACRCIKMPNVAERLAKSDVVFSGVVIAIGKYGAWLKIEKSWKGVSSDRIYIYTGNADDCGIFFKKRGERLLIYAEYTLIFNEKKTYGKKLMSQNCGRSSLLENAEDDLRELDKIKQSKQMPPKT